MGLGFKHVVLAGGLVCGLGACGSGAQEPSEGQMKEAMLEAMNHPPGEPASDPITIKFFKKEGCEAPTPRGYNCSFDVKVASSNLAASFYNDIPGAVFYKDKDSGKWVMRPPF